MGIIEGGGGKKKIIYFQSRVFISPLKFKYVCLEPYTFTFRKMVNHSRWLYDFILQKRDGRESVRGINSITLEIEEKRTRIVLCVCWD